MDLFQALKKGRTVSEITQATGMTRGGVVQAIRRNRKLIKKVGTKREHERGPESTIYKLKAGAKPKAKRVKRYATEEELKESMTPERRQESEKNEAEFRALVEAADPKRVEALLSDVASGATLLPETPEEVEPSPSEALRDTLVPR